MCGLSLPIFALLLLYGARNLPDGHRPRSNKMKNDVEMAKPWEASFHCAVQLAASS
jgi:hypothetical protein